MARKTVYIEAAELERRGACSHGLASFRAMFGERAELTLENVRRFFGSESAASAGIRSLFITWLMPNELAVKVNEEAHRRCINGYERALFRLGAYSQYMGCPLV
jgi:hypothetical protein